MIVPFPPWRPDTADIGGDGTVALGVVPGEVEDNGVIYKPFQMFGALGSALAAQCRGAYATLDADGDTHVFAGTATKLYKDNAGAWDDATRASGGDYALADEAIWKFSEIQTETAQYIFALGDVNADIQVFDLNSSSDFAQLSSDAPRAKCGAVVDGNILMVGNTWDPTDGYRTGRVWWHSRNSLTGAPLPGTWPTPGSSQAQEEQSDFRDLDVNGPIAVVTGPLGGSVGGLVFAQKSIHRLNQAPPIGYQFFKISEDIGCIAPNSVIIANGRAFFLSHKGLAMTDGQNVALIGSQKVNKWLFRNIDESKLHRVFTAEAPRLQLVIWAFASRNGSGLCDYLLALNHEIMEFSLISDSEEIEYIFNSLSTGLTLEELDAIYGDLDSIPISLDSPALQGGRPFFGAFNGSHVYGAYEGDTFGARIETGELAQSGNKRFRSTGIRPLIEAANTLAAGDVTAAIGYRDVPNGTITYDTATNIADNGICHQLRSAKFQRARISIAEGVEWTSARGAEYEFTLEGRF